MNYSIKLDKPEKLKLSKIDPGETHGLDESTSSFKATELGKELAELQELLYAAGTHSVLVVLQGMDTSGKDGTISHVFDSVNPTGVNVASFKVPTALELSHDFLWRAHTVVPAKGHMTIFNRSHYEDVLVTRVHKLITEKVWTSRYDQINEFESILAENDTIILKFFLHISNEEQEKRLLEREADPEKAWKLSAGDWQERKLWDQYQLAYQDAIGKTSTSDAPWHIVPSNHKWFRNLAIAEALASTLRPYRKQWEKQLAAVAVAAKAQLAAYRASEGNSVPTESVDTPKDGKNGGKHKHGK